MLVKPDRVLLLESSTPVSGLIIVVLPKKFFDLMEEVFGGLLTRLVNARRVLKKNIAEHWLVNSNWIRTRAWSGRGVIVTMMLVRILQR